LVTGAFDFMQLDLSGQNKLTRQEAAARLRVHTDTLDRWADAGLIRPMRYPSPNGGRPTIRYTITEIDRFEREAMSR
jgi:predicted site-specific integrase-resolvase